MDVTPQELRGSEIKDSWRGYDRVDADALEQYVAGYRDRIRAAIEGDLAKLGGEVEPPSERPELHDVEVPVEREPVTAAVVDEPEVDVTPAPDAPESAGDGTADWDSGAATRAISALDARASDPAPFASESAAVSPIVAPPRPEPAEWPPTPSADAATGPVPVVESS